MAVIAYCTLKRRNSPRRDPLFCSASKLAVVLANIDGGPGGTRTHDHKIKSPVLYQLSYRPEPNSRTIMAREPP